MSVLSHSLLLVVHTALVVWLYHWLLLHLLELILLEYLLLALVWNWRSNNLWLGLLKLLDQVWVLKKTIVIGCSDRCGSHNLVDWVGVLDVSLRDDFTDALANLICLFHHTVLGYNWGQLVLEFVDVFIHDFASVVWQLIQYLHDFVNLVFNLLRRYPWKIKLLWVKELLKLANGWIDAFKDHLLVQGSFLGLDLLHLLVIYLSLLCKHGFFFSLLHVSSRLLSMLNLVQSILHVVILFNQFLE